ncbi:MULTISPECIES: thymidine kinase [unclassified Nesterenkonia]|uniref:thymidine kinase n=1 Tax=unclassified Nesterenkonia TaxID=2629769 RepID=UPI001F4C608F|nr:MULTISPECIES: thymidine kinase [unclassified Nesterenkonia]MCH8560129.1 thymidine kinase [Nesterenkonia sp. DZ6]MCH8564047.1 thymidine kinase [Nesterenkonia sp. YGD6]
MAKLYFRYGAMNSGKSTGLLQAAFNYEERGQRVLLAKPQVDTKGEDEIVSRLGVTRNVDFLIPPQAPLRDLVAQHAAGTTPGTLLDDMEAESGALNRQIKPVACLLVDEAQFLTPAQVEDLLRIAVLDDVPVLAYGIRTDFRTMAFPGSARLMDLAHALEELKTICRCGRKAVFNTRRAGDAIIFDGDQVAIDGTDIWYESLCAACYLEASGGRLG